MRYLKTIAVCLLLAVVCGQAAIAPSAVWGQSTGGEQHAGLVLQFPDGSVQTYCMAFNGESVSGLDLLLKTGLDVKIEAYGGMGALVCKIGQTGCDYPEQPCACRSYGPDGVYWSYHHLKAGKWQSSSVGAGGYRVRDGEVDGWAWSAGKPPPVRTFAQICGAQPAPPPAATANSTPVQVPPSPTRPAVPTSSATRTARPYIAPPTPTTKPALARTATPTARAERTPTGETARAVTPRPPLPTASPTPSPAGSARPTDTPIPADTYTPAGVPTLTSTPTPTATATMTHTPTALPSPTPPPSPSPLSSPTQAAPGSAGDGSVQARVVGIAAGLGCALAFVLWRVIAAGRRPGREV